MKFHVHGGKNEIGGNCIEIINEGKSIILDVGIPVEANKPHKDYMPNIKGLYEKDPNLLGIFISHSHIDHFGLLKYLKQEKIL
ncbi:MAG: MBL fold metallo-hydrolase [Candidatus Muirbacterium halophilum]|nr:MBL fold metallo-hydrolase [Candidatus Muirbacterium halophilum]MCK9476749.1 MBL fold metallo-hydrolase [Candidatus Muirbacterium halophilum]